MNRRQMLAGLGAIVGAGATVAAVKPERFDDRHHYHGWWVGWYDYVEPANQLVLFGKVLAIEEPLHSGARMLAGTSLGTCGAVHELETLRTDRQPGWPLLMVASSAEEREDVRRRTIDLMHRAIDTLNRRPVAEFRANTFGMTEQQIVLMCADAERRADREWLHAHGFEG